MSKVTYDFQIVSVSGTPGISLVYPQNEDAYNYLVEEARLSTFEDGSAPIYRHRAGDFISDAGHAHFACEYV